MLNNTFFASFISKLLVDSIIIPITIQATDNGQCIAVPTIKPPPSSNSAGKDCFVRVSAPIKKPIPEEYLEHLLRLICSLNSF